TSGASMATQVVAPMSLRTTITIQAGIAAKSSVVAATALPTAIRLTARDSLARCGISRVQASVIPTISPQIAEKTNSPTGSGERARESALPNPAASATTSDAVSASILRADLLSGSAIGSLDAGAAAGAAPVCPNLASIR